MRIVCAQINPTIGDLEKNFFQILDAITYCRSLKADLIVFSELTLTGYPPKDLLFFSDFIEQIEKTLADILPHTQGIGILIGFPRQVFEKDQRKLYNSVAFIEDGKIVDYADKILLPNYDVFDEKRYFDPGDHVKIWTFRGFRLGVTICEDAWLSASSFLEKTHPVDLIQDFINASLDCFINISASPYSFSKFEKRLANFSRIVNCLKCPVIFCNQVGANDSLIFDGYSFCLYPDRPFTHSQGFKTDFLTVEVESKPVLKSIQSDHSSLLPLVSPIERLYHALVMGTKDYFSKSGFTKVCLGLSGGVDSAVVACLAKEALGSDSVLALMMPSRFSSPESKRDAYQLVNNLTIKSEELTIEPLFELYLTTLEPYFAGKNTDFTEENIQARIRSMLLMAFCNKFDYCLLNTGNKSELAMGYTTLYGDLCGALGVLGDVTKTQVYELAHWINRDQPLIPPYILTRPPSAELRFDQKDSDSLPDYAIIDHVLENYLEHYQTPEKIAHSYGYPLTLVQEIIRKLYMNEYKRRQAPLSLRVSEKSFSIGRQFPIVQGWIK